MLEPSDTLTPRELQILKFIGLGLPLKAVAEKVAMKQKNFEYHFAKLKCKIKLQSLTEIARYAVDSGLVVKGEKAPQDSPKVKLPPIDITGLADLKKAVLRGATSAANGECDPMQTGAMCQCSDAYVRIIKAEMDAAMSGRTLS